MTFHIAEHFFNFFYKRCRYLQVHHKYHDESVSARSASRSKFRCAPAVVAAVTKAERAGRGSAFRRSPAGRRTTWSRTSRQHRVNFQNYKRQAVLKPSRYRKIFKKMGTGSTSSAAGSKKMKSSVAKSDANTTDLVAEKGLAKTSKANKAKTTDASKSAGEVKKSTDKKNAKNKSVVEDKDSGEAPSTKTNKQADSERKATGGDAKKTKKSSTTTSSESKKRENDPGTVKPDVVGSKEDHVGCSTSKNSRTRKAEEENKLGGPAAGTSKNSSSSSSSLLPGSGAGAAPATSSAASSSKKEKQQSSSAGGSKKKPAPQELDDDNNDDDAPGRPSRPGSGTSKKTASRDSATSFSVKLVPGAVLPMTDGTASTAKAGKKVKVEKLPGGMERYSFVEDEEDKQDVESSRPAEKKLPKKKTKKEEKLPTRSSTLLHDVAPAQQKSSSSASSSKLVPRAGGTTSSTSTAGRPRVAGPSMRRVKNSVVGLRMSGSSSSSPSLSSSSSSSNSPSPKRKKRNLRKIPPPPYVDREPPDMAVPGAARKEQKRQQREAKKKWKEKKANRQKRKLLGQGTKLEPIAEVDGEDARTRSSGASFTSRKMAVDGNLNHIGVDDKQEANGVEMIEQDLLPPAGPSESLSRAEPLLAEDVESGGLEDVSMLGRGDKKEDAPTSGPQSKRRKIASSLLEEGPADNDDESNNKNRRRRSTGGASGSSPEQNKMRGKKKRDDKDVISPKRGEQGAEPQLLVPVKAPDQGNKNSSAKNKMKNKPATSSSAANKSGPPASTKSQKSPGKELLRAAGEGKINKDAKGAGPPLQDRVPETDPHKQPLEEEEQQEADQQPPPPPSLPRPSSNDPNRSRSGTNGHDNLQEQPRGLRPGGPGAPGTGGGSSSSTSALLHDRTLLPWIPYSHSAVVPGADLHYVPGSSKASNGTDKTGQALRHSARLAHDGFLLDDAFLQKVRTLQQKEEEDEAAKAAKRERILKMKRNKEEKKIVEGAKNKGDPVVDHGDAGVVLSPGKEKSGGGPLTTAGNDEEASAGRGPDERKKGLVDGKKNPKRPVSPPPESVQPGSLDVGGQGKINSNQQDQRTPPGNNSSNKPPAPSKNPTANKANSSNIFRVPHLHQLRRQQQSPAADRTLIHMSQRSEVVQVDGKPVVVTRTNSAGACIVLPSRHYHNQGGPHRVQTEAVLAQEDPEQRDQIHKLVVYWVKNYNKLTPGLEHLPQSFEVKSHDPDKKSGTLLKRLGGKNGAVIDPKNLAKENFIATGKLLSILHQFPNKRETLLSRLNLWKLKQLDLHLRMGQKTREVMARHYGEVFEKHKDYLQIGKAGAGRAGINQDGQNMNSAGRPPGAAQVGEGHAQQGAPPQPGSTVDQDDSETMEHKKQRLIEDLKQHTREKLTHPLLAQGVEAIAAQTYLRRDCRRGKQSRGHELTESLILPAGKRGKFILRDAEDSEEVDDEQVDNKVDRGKSKLLKPVGVAVVVSENDSAAASSSPSSSAVGFIEQQRNLPNEDDMEVDQEGNVDPGASAAERTQKFGVESKQEADPRPEDHLSGSPSGTNAADSSSARVVQMKKKLPKNNRKSSQPLVLIDKHDVRIATGGTWTVNLFESNNAGDFWETNEAFRQLMTRESQNKNEQARQCKLAYVERKNKELEEIRRTSKTHGWGIVRIMDPVGNVRETRRRMGREKKGDAAEDNSPEGACDIDPKINPLDLDLDDDKDISDGNGEGEDRIGIKSPAVQLQQKRSLSKQPEKMFEKNKRPASPSVRAGIDSPVIEDEDFDDLLDDEEDAFDEDALFTVGTDLNDILKPSVREQRKIDLLAAGQSKTGPAGRGGLKSKQAASTSSSFYSGAFHGQQENGASQMNYRGVHPETELLRAAEEDKEFQERKKGKQVKTKLIQERTVRYELEENLESSKLGDFPRTIGASRIVRIVERRELGEDVATSLEEDQELHEGDGDDVEFLGGRSGKHKYSEKKSKRGISPLSVGIGKRGKDHHDDFLPAQADDFEFDFDEGDGLFDASAGIKNRKEEKVKASTTSKRNENLPGVVPPAALKTTSSSGTAAGIRSQSGQERNNKAEAFIFNRTVSAAAANTGFRNNNNGVVDEQPLIEEVVVQDVDEHQHDEQQDDGKIEQNKPPTEGLGGGQVQGKENENQVNFEDQTSSDGIIASDSEEGRREEGRPQDDGRSRPNESTVNAANGASGTASQNAPAADEDEGDDHYWDDMFEA
ncbi:unnamed protein product [Amoebophrya sp. A120]|nr:unnamed protein product [Amoebophrya sp. A120]|eukprot:GSA120T00014115001.1